MTTETLAGTTITTPIPAKPVETAWQKFLRDDTAVMAVLMVFAFVILAGTIIYAKLEQDRIISTGKPILINEKVYQCRMVLE